MKVLLIGSNPSVKSPDNSEFHPDTRSRAVIDEWFKDIHDVSMSFINVVDYKKPGNKPLSVREIKESLPELKGKIEQYNEHKIVALGKTATKAMKLLTYDFLEAPHPSGLNRKLNDPEFVKSFIEDLTEYIR